MAIALRFDTKKRAPSGPHFLFLPFANRFSALLALALAIASDLPGLSPGPLLNSSLQFMPG